MRTKDQIQLENAYEQVLNEGIIGKTLGTAALAASMFAGQPQAKADDFQNKQTEITQATDNLRSSINVSRDLLKIADLAGKNKLNGDVLKKLREQAKQLLGAKTNVELDQKLNQYSSTSYEDLNFLKISHLGESYVNSENFVHGIQPISEAKKKELPLALKKAIEKKTGKKFGKKNKEEPTKGFIKSAKKSGKKITSDKVKPKKK
jgi:CRISPR/Cas system-associated protein Cas5 (RAMP superfamily)